jgi:RND family efflux transporter MFP subunit
MNKKKIFAIGMLIVATLAVYLVLMNNRAKMKAVSDSSFTLSDFPVTVATVARQAVSLDFSQVGVIAADRDVMVVSETQGRVIAVMVKVGSYVKAGAALVQVDDELPRSRFNAARIQFEKARKDQERMESLYKDGVISLSQLEGARLGFQAAEADYTAAKRYLDNTFITAPINGVVSARAVEYGSMVAPGMVVANIVDISRLRLKLNLAEEDAFKVKVGDAVEITTDIYPKAKFAGRIESISAKGDEAHTYPVEIAFSNSGASPLKAGMFGRARFLADRSLTAITIPRDALVGSVKEPQIYLLENGKARLRKLLLGTAAGSNWVVLDGLREGETIIISGQNNLSDNMKVVVVKK